MTKEEGIDFLLNMADSIGTTAMDHWSYELAKTMRDAIDAIQSIDIDDLSAEAEKLGYYLVKKPNNPGRLLKHCGKYPFRTYYPENVEVEGDLYFHKKMYVKCKICGKTVEKIYQFKTKDFMRADIGRLWNEEIEKELNNERNNTSTDRGAERPVSG